MAVHLRHPHHRAHLLPWIGLVAGASLFALSLLPGAPSERTTAGHLDGDYIVVQHILLAGDAISRPDEDVPGNVSAQYVVNNHKWAAGSMPIPVAYNAAGEPTGIDGAQIVKDSIDKWTAVSPATFSFSWAGASTGGTGACGDVVQRDTVNTVRFVDDLQPGVLGRTCTVWPAAGGANAPLAEFDMELSSEVNWSTAATTPPGHYDLWSTILHELGHAAGLGHTKDYSGVMWATLKAAQQKRDLTTDDREGIFAAYPGAPPTPTASPTALPTPDFQRNFSILTPNVARD